MTETAEGTEEACVITDEEGLVLEVNSVFERLFGLAQAAEFVKIDRSIVVAAATGSNARAVLMAMAVFARQTGTFAIAEGIEDGDTLEFLRSIANNDLSSHTFIEGGQGFGLGRPSHDLSPQSPAILHGGPGCVTNGPYAEQAIPSRMM
jgi:hypothetical protein